jgi:hypothetical protein
VNLFATEQGGWLPLIVMVVFSFVKHEASAEFESLAKDGPHLVVPILS